MPNYGQALDYKAYVATLLERNNKLKLIANNVNMADVYYWDEQLQKVVRDASAKLPDQVHIEPPTQQGFYYLSTPHPFINPDTDEIVQCSAIAWFQTVDENYFIIGISNKSTGIGVVGLGPLPIKCSWIKKDVYDRCRVYLDLIDMSTYVKEVEEHALDIMAANNGMASLFLAASFLFLNQRILTTAKGTLHRHDIRRAKRNNIPPEIRIIILRRTEHQHEYEHETRDVSWQWQWLVSGHWRHYKHNNNTIWISPYIKGPQDKPMKPVNDKVFAVVK